MAPTSRPPAWLRRFPAGRHDWTHARAGSGRPVRLRTDRMRVLVAIPSTNQMYSGIGRAIVELSRRLRDRVDFTFALDDRDPRSLRRVWDLAAPMGARMLVGPHRFESDCVEPTNDHLPEILSNDRWDAIELIG